MSVNIGTVIGTVQVVKHGGTVIQLRGGGGSGGGGGWKRPSGWKPLPPILPGDEALQGLVAVYNNDGNYVALACNIRGPISTVSLGAGGLLYSAGDTGTLAANGANPAATYVVDTVDGVTGAVLTFHIVAAGGAYQPASGVATAVGGSQPGSGDGNFTINVLTVASGGGYHVDWGDGNTENVAAGVKAQHQYAYADVGDVVTVNGVTYRQAVISVTPQSSQHLVDIDFQQIHDALSALPPQNTPWLDVAVGSTHLKTLNVAAGALDDAHIVVVFNALQQFTIGANAIVDLSYQFAGQPSSLVRLGVLASLKGGDFPALTEASSMFYSCFALQSVTLGDFPALTDASYMFYSCFALQSVTLGDFPALTDASYMFYSCFALQSVTLGDFPALTDVSSMFSSCPALQSVTLGDLSALTNASFMFYLCDALQSVTLVSMPVTVDFTACNLGRAAIVAIFNALATVAGQTVTVTNNYGSAALTAPDLAIATDKGWTVVQ